MSSKILSPKLKFAAALLAPLLVIGLAGAAPKADPSHGKSIFENRCSECHLADSKDETTGPGLKGLSAGRLPDGRRASHEVLLDIVNTGPGEMTAFKDILTEQEKEDVIAYVMTL